MPDGQYTLNQEAINKVAEYVCLMIKPHFFCFDGDLPIPEEDEIRQAILQGGGYIRLTEGQNRFLVVTHRNGSLVVFEAIERGAVLSGKSFRCNWDDTYRINDSQWIHVDSDGFGMYVQEREEDGKQVVDVAMLQLTSLNIQPFIDGLMASEPAQVS